MGIHATAIWDSDECLFKVKKAIQMVLGNYNY